MSLNKIEFEIDTIYPSLNTWYAGTSWKKRHSQATKVKMIIKNIITQKYSLAEFKQMVYYKVVIFYNNKYDCDNVVPIVKLAVDSIKELGLVIEDNANYFKGYCIAYDDDLQRGKTIVIIEEIVGAHNKKRKRVRKKNEGDNNKS